MNWLWAWENASPEKAITGLRFEPVNGLVIVSAITAGEVAELPLRWEPRRKALLTLPTGAAFRADLDDDGLLQQIELDLGQVISATPRLIYPNEIWTETYNNQLPEITTGEVVVEYTAHPEACFHLPGGTVIRTIYANVRFGNVTWSSGSAFPLFSDKIRDGVPLKITSLDMERYYMTIEDAVRLVFKAFAEMKGGETFILKMPTFKMGDLVNAMAIVNGEEIPYEITGIREGEKMKEVNL